MDLNRFIEYEITKKEALELTKLKGSKLNELFLVANKIREKYCGNEIHTCTITNAKSGACPENCKFCAQSSHYNTNINSYNLKEEETLLNEYERAVNLESSKFGVVTSGRSIKKGSNDFENIKSFLENAKEKGLNTDLCCSMGLLNEEELLELKSKGATRFHSNLQTSVESYSEIVSNTHDINDRIATIKLAKKVGMSVCSGGIIGMGESWEDRISMAFTLKDLDVDGIPVNILNPIPGTPHGNREPLSVDETLKTIAIYRIIFKDKVIKLAAGRENILKDFMGSAFMCGANGMLVGGYLTLRGREAHEDKKFIENIKKLWD